MIDASGTISLWRLLGRTFSAGGGRWIAQILSILFWPLALAYIAASEFGLYSLVQIAALVCGVVMSFGLSAAYLAAYAGAGGEEDNLLGRILGLQFGLGGLFLALFMGFGAAVASWIGAAETSLPFRVLLASQYLANLTLVFGRWQILTNRHAHLSIVAVWRMLAQFILLVILVIWNRLGLIGLALADLGGNAAALFVAWYLGRGIARIELRLSDSRLALKYGLPAVPDPIFYWLMLFVPLFALKSGGMLALAGAFSLGWKLVSPVDLLGNSLASAAADRLAAKDGDGPGLSRWYRLSIAAIVIGATGTLLFASDVLRWFFSDDYHQTSALMPFMAAAVMFLAFYYFEWIRVNAAGKTLGLSLASGSGAAVVALGAAIGFRQGNALAPAFFFALGFMIMWVVARGASGRRPLGKWYILLGCVIASSTVGWLAQSLPDNLPAGMAKVLILAIPAIIVGAKGLGLLAREYQSARDGDTRFALIPNYAEIARNLGRVSTYLDVGCSEGFFLREVESTGPRVGVDADLKRLRAGHAERPDLMLVCASADRLPLESARFDVVVLIGVLPYLKEPSIALREAHRVLRRAGRIELSTASDFWLYRFLNVYAWKHRVAYYSPESLGRLLRDCGFDARLIYSRGRLLTTILGNLFPLWNYIDRIAGHGRTVLGPSARRLRELTNPLIAWDYAHHRGEGYQLFASGVRSD